MTVDTFPNYVRKHHKDENRLFLDEYAVCQYYVLCGFRCVCLCVGLDVCLCVDLDVCACVWV